MNQKGLANLLAVGLILGISMVLLSSVIIYQKNSDKSQQITANIEMSQPTTVANTSTVVTNTNTSATDSNSTIVNTTSIVEDTEPPPININAATTVPVAGLCDTIGWETYTNTEYDFSLQHPTDWNVTVDRSPGTDVGRIEVAESAASNGDLRIHPRGEFDHGGPLCSPTIETTTIDGYVGDRRNYNAATSADCVDYAFIFLDTYPASWGEYNRFDVQGDIATVDCILTTLTFTE